MPGVVLAAALSRLLSSVFGRHRVGVCRHDSLMDPDQPIWTRIPEGWATAPEAHLKQAKVRASPTQRPWSGVTRTA
jgi:hypothetical protein